MVSQEDDPVSYGGSMKAPKILADIVESIAAAVYVDIGFNLTKLWVVCSLLFLVDRVHSSLFKRVFKGL